MNKIADTKAAGEVKALENFYSVLQTEPAKAFYGKRHIEKANEGQAIETLLISDSLFRCRDVSQRKDYVKLVDSVREYGGDVKIFSSMHISGERKCFLLLYYQMLVNIGNVFVSRIGTVDWNCRDTKVSYA